jgi:tRNA dimethylallyltransferase
VVANDKPPVLFLMGPTATGKTDLAIALGSHISIEVINVDSALVYRGMDIGTAKPEPAVLDQVPHHLIDIRDPVEAYSAAEFYRDATVRMKEIVARGRLPVLAGGTMLYFKVLLEGLADLPPSDAGVRRAICDEAEERGWPAMHRELAAVDPETAASLHPNHSQRIQRALEIYRLTGVAASQLKARQQQENSGIRPIGEDYEITQVALLPRNRTFLHERIAKRFELMLEQGFESEVIALRARGDLGLDLPAMRAVGYRQMWEHLDGQYGHDVMVESAVAATRQLAKRQLTWLRGWPDLQALYVDDGGNNLVPKQNLLSQILKLWQVSTIYKSVSQ